MKFTKMQGIGNDYVYVNGFSETVTDPARVAKEVSDRHFGIGADGLILILPSKLADVRMQMFNADGSEAEMCGNGVRCVAKYAFERGIAVKNPMRVETGNGVLSAIQHEYKKKAERYAKVDEGDNHARCRYNHSREVDLPN
jgi:diaminopimelate epimerase